MRDSKISMVRHPMEINDDGIKVLWDKSLNISPAGAKIYELPADIKEEMKKAVEEADKGVHEVQEEF
ncbi:MAG: KaiC domain-containing protein, partial [Nitrososphaeria archaeon]